MPREVRLPEEGRWRGRPVASFLVRVFVLLVPVAAGVGIAILVGSVLPAPATTVGVAGWWALLLGCSTAAAYLADRIARRLLPLAVLLKLTLLFPDRAPSRYVLARAAGNTRLLERRVREARARGVADDPAHAAEMVLTLVAALAAHDRRTRGHSERVRAFVDLLADELHLPPDARPRLRWAALLHDIGKLQIEAEILNKKARLDGDDWDAIRAHPEAGARLAAPLLPWLGEWGRAIIDHHERFDGSGYPRRISGQDISLAGRITSIADAFETMTSARSYKKPVSVLGARRELTKCAGAQFDPALVRAFLNVSIGRLMWVIGPMTWLAQIPVVRKVVWAGQETATTAKSAALAKTLAGVVALGMSGAVGPQQPRSADPLVPAAPAPRAVVAGPSALETLMPAAQPETEEREEGGTQREGDRGGGGDGGPADSPAGDSDGPAEDGPDGGDDGGSSAGLIGDTVDVVEDVVEDVVDDVVEPVIDDTVDEIGEVVDDITDLLP